MLVLTRKLMEKLYIGDAICVTVVRLEGGQVRLGIEAPREVAVLRAELATREREPSHRPPIAGRSPPPRSGLADRGFAEPVSDAADRLDEVGRLAHLLAQALDVDVDGPLQDDGVLADRGVHQLVTGEGPPRLAEQGLRGGGTRSG